MWLRIDPQSGVPIYRQIAGQVEQAVAAGFLVQGDRLPAVRELALQLAVNPGTVVKAYDELERAGIIEKPRGVGTFVSASPRLTAAERLARLRTLAASSLSEARRLGFTPTELRDAITAAARAGEEGDDAGTGRDG